MGCFILLFADAVKEGDGHRVLRYWRYLLPIFKGSGRKNYAVEVCNMLYQYEYQLTPRQSEELIWSRFVNTRGVRGRNIAADLHLEHLNRVCKESIRGLGANKTEAAITRVAKALGTLSPILEQFDNDNRVSTVSGAHCTPGFEKDRDRILLHLQQYNISALPGRCHSSFPKPRHVLHNFNKTTRMVNQTCVNNFMYLCCLISIKVSFQISSN